MPLSFASFWRLIFVVVGLFGTFFVLPSSADAFKYYGRWCGPAHGFKGEPIDAVDAACKAHDICCKANQHPPVSSTIQHCSCDALLLRETRAALSTKLSAKARAAALTIIGYFEMTACFCIKRVCLPVPKCTTQEKCTKIAGKRICVKKPSCKTETVCTKKTIPGQGGKCL